jgi:hypothetical protein
LHELNISTFRALSGIDPAIALAKLDFCEVFANEFVNKANAKHPKG